MKFNIKAIVLTLMFLLSFNPVARAHGSLPGQSSNGGSGKSCDELLTGNSAAAEAIPEKTREEHLAAFEAALTKLEKMPLNGGTSWIEARLEKRRQSVLESFKKPGFSKLLLVKPELRTVFEAWSRALDKMADIQSGYAGLNEVEKKAFLSVYDAIRSALTAHALSWSTVSVRSLDLPRANKILEEIANFDVKRTKYSLYRIERAIEGRYSLREYAECR